MRTNYSIQYSSWTVKPVLSYIWKASRHPTLWHQSSTVVGQVVASEESLGDFGQRGPVPGDGTVEASGGRQRGVGDVAAQGHVGGERGRGGVVQRGRRVPDREYHRAPSQWDKSTILQE